MIIEEKDDKMRSANVSTMEIFFYDAKYAWKFKRFRRKTITLLIGDLLLPPPPQELVVVEVPPCLLFAGLP